MSDKEFVIGHGRGASGTRPERYVAIVPDPLSDSQTVTFPHPLVAELRAGAETLARYAAARPLDELAGLLNGASSLMSDAADELQAAQR